MKAEIISLLKKHIELPTLPEHELEELDLEQYGLDSLKSITLILEMEEHFDIEFPDEMLSFNNLTTVRRICETVSVINSAGIRP